MQRLQRLSFVHRQLACFLQSNPTRAHRTSTILKIGDPIATRTQQSVSEPFTLFRFDHGGFIPITDDADQIYAANLQAVEEHCIEQLLPEAIPKLKTTRRPVSNNHNSPQDLEIGLISHEVTQLIDKNDQTTNTTHSTVSCSHTVNTDGGGQSNQSGENNKSDSNMPNEKTLLNAKATLTEQIPKFFSHALDYSIVTQDIILENNLQGRNKTTVGYKKYATELAKLKAKANFAYASIEMYIIKISADTEQGMVNVRWTMRGISQLEAMKFWKWNLFNINRSKGVKDKMRSARIAHDGVCIFHINPSGDIFKLRIDKVIPADKSTETSRVEKLGQKAAAKILGQPSTASTSSTDHR